MVDILWEFITGMISDMVTALHGQIPLPVMQYRVSNILRVYMTNYHNIIIAGNFRRTYFCGFHMDLPNIRENKICELGKKLLCSHSAQYASIHENVIRECSFLEPSTKILYRINLSLYRIYR